MAKLRLLLPGALLVALSGCYANGYAVNRGLHYVTDADGNEQLVHSPPPSPAAYEAYLRARLALERDQLDEARGHALEALRSHVDDPQLWTTLGEVEWRLGNFAAAEQAIARALALRPGYPEAERLLASIHAQTEL